MLFHEQFLDAYAKIGSPVKPKGFVMSFIQAAIHGRVESECAGRNPRGHSVRICDGNTDNMKTLYRLRRASGRPADYI